MGAFSGQYIFLAYLHYNIFYTQSPVSHKIGAVIGHLEIPEQDSLFWAQDKSGHLIGKSDGQAA